MIKAMTVKMPSASRCPSDYWRMIRLLLIASYIVALCLAHIHLRMAARDMNMQAGRYQAQAADLLNRESVLKSEIGRLRGGDRMLDYAREKLGLIALPVIEIEVWKMPNQMVDRYRSVCSEIALARTGRPERGEGQSLFSRLAVAFFTPGRPVQAQPASQEH